MAPKSLGPLSDMDQVLSEVETHVLSRLKLARSPYIQVMRVSRSVGERRIDIDALVDGAEVKMVCEVWDDPNGIYFDTWVEIPICDFESGQREEIYRYLLVQGGDYESRLFLAEGPGGIGSQLMMGRPTRCLDGLEELLAETLREARSLAKGLSEQFGVRSLPGTAEKQIH